MIKYAPMSDELRSILENQITELQIMELRNLEAVKNKDLESQYVLTNQMHELSESIMSTIRAAGISIILSK